MDSWNKFTGVKVKATYIVSKTAYENLCKKSKYLYVNHLHYLWISSSKYVVVKVHIIDIA